jgi:hypothetical protein
LRLIFLNKKSQVGDIMKSINFCIKTGLSVVLIVATLAMVNGCGSGGGGGGPTTQTSDVTKVFKAAEEFAAGNKADVDLKVEFDRLPDAEMEKLAKVHAGEDNFGTLLAKGRASLLVRDVLERFFSQLKPQEAVDVTEEKAANKDMFDLLGDAFGDSSQSPDSIYAETAVLVFYNPTVMEPFSGSSINDIIIATNGTKVPGLSDRLPDAKFTEWLNWAMEKDTTTGALKNQTVAQPAFKKLYAGANAPRQEAMRNELLVAVYGNNNIIDLSKMIEDRDDWGIEDAIASDKFKMAMNTGGDLEGNFLYVVVNKMMEDSFSLFDIRRVASKVKSAVGPQYSDYASVDDANANTETVVKALNRLTGNDDDSKLALDLISTVDAQYILDETARLADEGAAADRAVSARLAMLMDVFNDKGDFNALANTTATIDATNGGFKANDKFMHVLSYLKTDNNMLYMFNHVLGKVVDAKAVLADPGAGSIPLVILSKNAQIPDLRGGKEQDVIASAVQLGDSTDVNKIADRKDLVVVLDAVLERGKTADLQKAFAGVNANLVKKDDKNNVDGFAAWAFNNRDKAISDSADTGKTIGILCAEESTRRGGTPGEQERLWTGLMEVAIDNGRGLSGAVDAISKGFFTKAALEYRKYDPFGYFPAAEYNNTVLYMLLAFEASTHVRDEMKKVKNDITRTPALNAINVKIVTKNNLNNKINDAAGTQALGNIARAAFAGSLTKDKVHGLVEVMQPILGDTWNTACNDAGNASTKTKSVAQLLRFTVIGATSWDTIKAGDFLDCK